MTYSTNFSLLIFPVSAFGSFARVIILRPTMMRLPLSATVLSILSPPPFSPPSSAFLPHLIIIRSEHCSRLGAAAAVSQSQEEARAKDRGSAIDRIGMRLQNCSITQPQTRSFVRRVGVFFTHAALLFRPARGCMWNHNGRTLDKCNRQTFSIEGNLAKSPKEGLVAKIGHAYTM